MKLNELSKLALAKEVQLTFSIGNVKVGLSKVKKSVKFEATTDQGKVVSFWESNMDAVVEEIDPIKGLYVVRPGTIELADGSLIPAGSSGESVVWQ